MKAKITLINNTLAVVFTDVCNDDRGRLCGIELALLRVYGRHDTFPWANKTPAFLFDTAGRTAISKPMKPLAKCFKDLLSRCEVDMKAEVRV